MTMENSGRIAIVLAEIQMENLMNIKSFTALVASSVVLSVL
jgi:hypothetical protein